MDRQWFLNNEPHDVNMTNAFIKTDYIPNSITIINRVISKVNQNAA